MKRRPVGQRIIPRNTPRAVDALVVNLSPPRVGEPSLRDLFSSVCDNQWGRTSLAEPRDCIGDAEMSLHRRRRILSKYERNIGFLTVAPGATTTVALELTDKIATLHAALVVFVAASRRIAPTADDPTQVVLASALADADVSRAAYAFPGCVDYFNTFVGRIVTEVRNFAHEPLAVVDGAAASWVSLDMLPVHLMLHSDVGARRVPHRVSPMVVHTANAPDAGSCVEAKRKSCLCAVRLVELADEFGFFD